MKRLIPAILLLCFHITYNTSAQISQGGTPPGVRSGLSLTDIDQIIIAAPDMKLITAQDEANTGKIKPYRIGINLPVNMNMTNSGTWSDLPDRSGKVWRLRIKSAGALGLCLQFDDFYMPTGATFYIYNKDQNHIIGAFTEVNNNEDLSFATEVLSGDEAILEYFEPAVMQQKARISVSGITYIYRGMQSVINPKSGACEVNIACSEGNNWQDEKQGVVKVLTVISGGMWDCSGSLVNTTKGDCTPLVLLADHCSCDNGTYSSTADLNSWIFYFHYEASTCTGTSASGIKTMTGCTLKAHDTWGSNGNGSDFYLVQIKTAIPSNYNAYYNGWSRSTTPSTSGVGIHHPDGDIKKISTYNTTLSSVYVGGTGSHWEVTWAGTANGHGVTEQGSSGSPLFNSSSQIIGTLTSGYSACDALNEPDQYGKFSLHWSSNGTSSAKQLKPWLDPLNINPTSINGTYTCVLGIENDNSKDEGISCYPNPAMGSVTIDFGQPVNGGIDIRLFDLMGQQVRHEMLVKQSVSLFTLDLAELKGGIYYLTIRMNDRSLTRKIVLLDQ